MQTQCSGEADWKELAKELKDGVGEIDCKWPKTDAVNKAIFGALPSYAPYAFAPAHPPAPRAHAARKRRSAASDPPITSAPVRTRAAARAQACS